MTLRDSSALLPTLSVVIPTRNEARTLPDLLGDLQKLATPHQVVVVDGRSADGTAAAALAGGARVMSASGGRGGQLIAGIRAFPAPWFLILHGDARLPEESCRALDAAIATSRNAPTAPAFVLRLGIAASGLKYRIVERGTNLRTRLFSLPFGDQGMLVRRGEYDAAGGYPNWPILEDVALVERLRRVTRLQLLDASCNVSARRWEADGVIARTLRNWRIYFDYRRGVSPQELAERYE
jgi:rSAM/selenodomain-associated transferase 2